MGDSGDDFGDDSAGESPDGPQDDSEHPIVLPEWNENTPWVFLVSDDSDLNDLADAPDSDRPDGDAPASDGEAFVVDVPAAAEAELRAICRDVIESLSTDIELLFFDEHGKVADTWDNNVVRSNLRDAGDLCLEALGQSHIDLDRLANVLSAVELLSEFSEMDALVKLGADCQLMIFGRVRRRRDGSFSLRWHPVDLEVVSDAMAEVADLINSEDPATSRLFPAAYGVDDDRNESWNALERRELVDRRLTALASVDAMMRQRRCDEAELHSLMQCLNDARLVMGTQLEVDEHGPSAATVSANERSVAVYEHLTFLLAQVIRAMQTTV